MTCDGNRPPAARGEAQEPLAGADGPDGPDCGEWDDPLTRLLLLLEIADRPAWLRDLAHPAG